MNRNPKRLVLKAIAGARRWYANATSGHNTCDRTIMGTHGSDLCRTKARYTETLIVASSLIAGAGVAAKVWLSLDGPMVLVAAPAAAFLYARFMYALEGRIVTGLPPLQSTASKLMAVAGRSALACVFVGLQALPVISVVLHGPSKAEAIHMELENAQKLREQVAKAQGLPDLAVQGELLATDLRRATDAIDKMPANVTDAQAAVKTCDDKYEASRKTTALRLQGLDNRLRHLATLILSPKTLLAQREEAELKRTALRMEAERLRTGLRQLEQECVDKAKAYASARDDYRKSATTKRDATQADVDRLKNETRRREALVLEEQGRVTGAARAATADSQGALFRAMWRLVVEQLWAKIVALGIALFFLAADLAALLSKVLGAPGPYEHALAAAHAEAAADSRIRIEAAKRRQQGEAQFHEQDQGAVFARLRAMEHQLHEQSAVEARDIEMLRRRAAILSELAADLDALAVRVKDNPGLKGMLDELLQDIVSKPDRPHAA